MKLYITSTTIYSLICVLWTVNVTAQDDWKPLLDMELSQWEKFMGIPHTSVQGLPEGTFQSDDYKGTPLGLNNDQKNVISMIELEGAPVLYITGEIFGCVSTKESFENYHLSLQFKWGEKKWEPRMDKLRDSGILYHCFGKHGRFANVWKTCVESQVQEGDCGDVYLLGSKQDKDAPKAFATTTPVTIDGNTFNAWDPNGIDRLQDPRIVKRGNFEKPNGEWNTMEIYTFGDQAFHLVNGQVVMHITQIKRNDQPLTSGQIQIQSEGAEIYYRDIKIRSITEFPKHLMDGIKK